MQYQNYCRFAKAFKEKLFSYPCPQSILELFPVAERKIGNRYFRQKAHIVLLLRLLCRLLLTSRLAITDNVLKTSKFVACFVLPQFYVKKMMAKDCFTRFIGSRGMMGNL